MMKVTKEMYEQALAKVNASEVFWDKHATGRKGGPRSLAKEFTGKDPASNEDRTVVEVYRFEVMDAGASSTKGYTAYWKDGDDPTLAFGQTVVTFTGETLGTVTRWDEYESRGATRSKRVAFRAFCRDGYEYAGTYFKSSGSYVRMRRVKLQPLTSTQEKHRQSLNKMGPMRTLSEEMQYRVLTVRHQAFSGTRLEAAV